MNRVRNLTPAVCLTAFVLLVAAPALAQTTLQAGIDALVSSPGTKASVDVPADFFCPGSAPVNAFVELQGVPLTTNPPGALGFADTVIERLKPAKLAPGSCADVPVAVRAVSLESVPGQELIVFCPATGESRWKVNACTCGCCGVQPITTVTICDDGSGEACGQSCGFFAGDLRLSICLRFTNLADGTVLGPIQDQVSLKIANTPFCENNPGTVTEFKDAVMVDTNCDGQSNLAVQCTSNFFPGATCGGPSCPPPVCHENPGGTHDHCVQLECGEKR